MIVFMNVREKMGARVLDELKFFGSNLNSGQQKRLLLVVTSGDEDCEL